MGGMGDMLPCCRLIINIIAMHGMLGKRLLLHNGIHYAQSQHYPYA